MARVDLADPTTATLVIATALDAAGLRGAVYGGLALAAYGEARETKDADFAVVGVATPAALEALTRAELAPSLSFEKVRFGGLEITRIALFGTGGHEGFNVVDLVEPRSLRYARLVLERAPRGTLREQPVTIVSPEDFVLLKVLSTRDRDVDDAASVVRTLGGEIDRELLAREVTELAGELPDHQVAERFAAVLARLSDVTR